MLFPFIFINCKVPQAILTFCINAKYKSFVDATVSRKSILKSSVVNFYLINPKNSLYRNKLKFIIFSSYSDCVTIEYLFTGYESNSSVP